MPLTHLRCPVCLSPALSLHSDSVLDLGEVAGVVYDDAKTGCYDWQATVVGVACDRGHVFWVDPGHAARELADGRALIAGIAG